MVKARTNITIEPSLIEKAKEKFLNVSELTEKAIKEKLNTKEVVDGEKCEYCGREEPKAYVNHRTDEYHDGLTWLYPDEKWICSKCLKDKSIKNMRASKA